jgi:hypothetical protein
MIQKNWLCFGVFLLLIPIKTYSCECLHDDQFKSATEALDKSSLVFLGKVESVKLVSSQIIQMIRPTRVWKGSYNKIVELTVQSGKQCGYVFEPGKEYLIYANEASPNQVSKCGRTALKTKAKEDILALGKPCTASITTAVTNAENFATKHFKQFKKDFSNYPRSHIQIFCHKENLSVVFRERSIPVENITGKKVDGTIVFMMLDGIEASVKVNGETGEAISISLGS